MLEFRELWRACFKLVFTAQGLETHMCGQQIGDGSACVSLGQSVAYGASRASPVSGSSGSIILIGGTQAEA